jgi:flagellin
MGLRISTNVASLNAQRTMAQGQREINKSFAQMSSGSRITKAADDAAGLAISENLKSSIRSMGQASRNANDGVSMVQVAEGGLNEVSNILTRVRELGVQASSDTVGDDERGFIQKEVGQLTKEIERISQTTKYGKTALLNGEGGSFEFQVGIGNDDATDRIGFEASDLNATASNLGVDGFDFSSKGAARSALETIDKAQMQVSGFRASLGAIQNRLASTVDNLAVTSENYAAANSRIRDTDVAATSADLTKQTILQQASTSVLAQANNAPSVAMKLIG